MEKFEIEGSEQEFLQRYKEQEIQKYEKPSVTVDCVILRYYEGKVQLLTIKRKGHPFQGKYALAGGFVNPNEDLTHAVIREVEEETSVKLKPENVEQLVTVGTPFRDPRHWVITVAHIVYIRAKDKIKPVAGDDANSVHWLTVDSTSKGFKLLDGTIELDNDDFAFDHHEIISTAINRIKGRLNYNPTILYIMPKEFTLTEVRKMFSAFEFKFKNMNSTNFLYKHKNFFYRTGNRKVENGKQVALYDCSFN